jgi:L-lactate dehydrogenase complex protein LldE
MVQRDYNFVESVVYGVGSGAGWMLAIVALAGIREKMKYSDVPEGLRGLGIKAQPRALLGKVRGLSLKEMADCEECCGFGGAFAVKFGEVSTRIVDRKCESIAAVGADAVVGGDLGCLLNIEGRLRRRGDQTTQVLHIAEVLAGSAD